MRKVLLMMLLFTIISKLPSLFAQTTAATPTYPRAVAYLSLILPIIKLNRSQGPMLRFKHGLTLITRLAFETQGRYGFTPVLNKVYLRTKAVNYFIAASLPTRFGNNQLPSIGGSLQFGFIFN